MGAGVVAALAQATTTTTTAGATASGGGGAQSWVVTYLLPLVLVIIGVRIATHAGKGDHSKAIVGVGIVLMGLFICGIGIAGGAGTASTWLYNTFKPWA